MKNKKNRVFSIKDIESINLGSSHSECAFKFKDKNLNLALASQTFYYDLLLLKEYLKKYQEMNHKKIKCFLTISYFSFYAKEIWNDMLEKYYLLLPLKNFKGENFLRCFVYKYFPVFYKYLYKNKIIKKNKTEEEYRIYRIKKHVEYLNDEKNSDYNIELLEKIIHICKMNNLELILLTTPFQKEYNDYFKIEDLEKMYSKIKSISLKNNILYFDYSHDYINFNKNSYFQSQDFDHLSIEGAKKLIELLEKELEKNISKDIVQINNFKKKRS